MNRSSVVWAHDKTVASNYQLQTVSEVLHLTISYFFMKSCLFVFSWIASESYYHLFYATSKMSRCIQSWKRFLRFIKTTTALGHLVGRSIRSQQLTVFGDNCLLLLMILLFDGTLRGNTEKKFTISPSSISRLTDDEFHAIPWWNREIIRSSSQNNCSLSLQS